MTAAIGISAVFSVLYFALALGIRGEETAVALWQSLFCFAAVTAIMLVTHWIRAARN
ncbi:hypothetical protein [Nocardiopsis baichengensis]|uniref:hypothetical protein n=1 Tax=Nocardiopsis baichengensis TaxID=280240 RepID=UPI00037A3A60|nr:hypothetical protein [Nocardiopsis baichengensis]